MNHHTEFISRTGRKCVADYIFVVRFLKIFCVFAANFSADRKQRRFITLAEVSYIEDYYIVQNGNAISVRNDRETYKICITKPGYIPCTVIIGYNQYLQNQTIEGDVRLFSTNVAIGENVTNQTTPSPVHVVSGGNLVVSKKNEVFLDKGFSVAKGGTLEIKKW